MRSAINLGLGILIAAAVPGLHAQTANPMTTITGAKSALGGKSQAAQQQKPASKPATQAPAKPAPAKPAGQAAAKTAAKGQAKPSATSAKPAASAQAKPGAKPASKPARRVRAAKAKAAVKAVEKPATPGGGSAAESELRTARRDPFESLLAHSQGGKGAPNLPPGKAGLQVSTLRLDGIVRAPNGMIAVVSNPQSRVYFLREGDHLYDGSVEKITMDGVSFHEEGKDAFGKPVERQVNKRIYSTSSGEQQ